MDGWMDRWIDRIDMIDRNIYIYIHIYIYIRRFLGRLFKI